MIGLLQRVTEAQVDVQARHVSAIGPGLLVFACAEGDTDEEAERLVKRILDYRVFPDAKGKMNLSLRDVDGALLLVPQYTLAADTLKVRASVLRQRRRRKWRNWSGICWLARAQLMPRWPAGNSVRTCGFRW